MPELLYLDLQVILHGKDPLADVWVGGGDGPVLCCVVALQQQLHQEEAEVAQLVEDRRCRVGRRCCRHLKDKHTIGFHGTRGFEFNRGKDFVKYTPKNIEGML